AVQPAPYVGPGQVAWFQFTIQAPLVPGTYRLYLRPLVEGATWMEDFGVFWLVTVLNPDGTPPAPPPVTGLGYSLKTVSTPVGQLQAHVVKERLADVYVRSGTYDRSAVNAGISNYPALLAAGAVVDSSAQQSPTQMQRATRGAIGVDGTYIYLAIVPSASVTETAYVMQSLGARDALNLDGGGSAALWIAGSFKVGPGRQLPNAIVLTKP